MSLDLSKITFAQRRRLIEAAKKYALKRPVLAVHMPFDDCGADIVTVHLMFDPPRITEYQGNPYV